MEWVETTGRTLEEAKEAALDQLGVDEADAEFEVLEQPKSGLFGRMRGEARVRARVRPTAPRSKEDRRDRRRRARSAANGTGSATGGNASPAAGDESGGTGPGVRPESGRSGRSEERPARAKAPAASQGQGGERPSSPEEGEVGATSSSGRRRRRRRPSKGPGGDGGVGAPGPEMTASVSGESGESGESSAGGAGRSGGSGASGRSRREIRTEEPERRDGTEVEVPLQEQASVAEDFLTGLVGEFGLTANITVTVREEENLDLSLDGRDLGLLIGQKGTTLLAIQDLTRTVVQHKTSATNGRIHVDVGGYRQKRSEALAKFAIDVAGRVKQTGERAALEPMSAADRKVVHDALTGIEGVTTTSEGEEPRRRVVILPAG